MATEQEFDERAEFLSKIQVLPEKMTVFLTLICNQKSMLELAM